MTCSWSTELRASSRALITVIGTVGPAPSGRDATAILRTTLDPRSLAQAVRARRLVEAAE